ncbi:hypothetical protein OG874_11260 [Nocardia sp. NBC_00565]|uniref:hypothetical protein n=1 Tax=Nocardia sp. NBC_00565 TaxID=2975993 RepID=UPI002E81E9B1|nr:hypothetical protein [Nocardia sp. NBC_00565]WUC05676.1 hypothetical protein OG874_11260 [Nocardia sp. NBC_00565]
MEWDMPVHSSPTGPSAVFTIGCLVILVGLIVWWALSGESKRGPALPLFMLGTAISAVAVEPVFDNTLLYWYPPDNGLGVFAAYGRTVPWFVPLGYAWFFGGIAYVVWRYLQLGVDRRQVWWTFAVVALIDALATSLAGWLDLSGFYGPQPFMFGGVNVWFAFADATGVLVGATILFVLTPLLSGRNWLWLLVIPSISYGAVLGGVSGPVTLGLHSDWPTPVRWLAGAVTIGLCCAVIHGCSYLTAGARPTELWAEKGSRESASS